MSKCGICAHCGGILAIPSTHTNDACAHNLREKISRIRFVCWRVPGREGKWWTLRDAWEVARILGVKPVRIIGYKRKS